MRFEKEEIESAAGDWEMAKLCNDTLDKVSESRLDVLKHGDYAKSKIAWKFAVLRQSLTYRLVDLVEGTIAMWSTSHTLCALVLGRAALETVALIHSVEVQARAALDEKNLSRLDEIAMQQTFSARSSDFLLDPKFVATNILTALDRLDKSVPGVKKYFDSLSEYAHPNAKGHYFFYAKLDKKARVTTFAWNKYGKKETIRNITSACLGIYWVELSLQALDKMIPQVIDLQIELEKANSKGADAPKP